MINTFVYSSLLMLVYKKYSFSLFMLVQCALTNTTFDFNNVLVNVEININ